MLPNYQPTADGPAPAPADTAGMLERAPASGTADQLEAALTVLDTLDERPLSEHAEIYQGLHSRLQGALAEIDNA